MSDPRKAPQSPEDASKDSKNAPRQPSDNPSSGRSRQVVPQYPEVGHAGFTYPKWLTDHIHPNPATGKRNVYSYEFYTNEFRDQASAKVKARGPYGKSGRACKIAINSYLVEQWPNKDVHQYDVSCTLSPGL